MLKRDATVLSVQLFSTVTSSLLYLVQHPPNSTTLTGEKRMAADYLKIWILSTNTCHASFIFITIYLLCLSIIKKHPWDFDDFKYITFLSWCDAVFSFYHFWQKILLVTFISHTFWYHFMLTFAVEFYLVFVDNRKNLFLRSFLADI